MGMVDERLAPNLPVAGTLTRALYRHIVPKEGPDEVPELLSFPRKSFRRKTPAPSDASSGLRHTINYYHK